MVLCAHVKRSGFVCRLFLGMVLFFGPCYAAGAQAESEGNTAGAPSSRGAEAQKLLTRAGVKGGLVVHLGIGRGDLTEALGNEGPFLVRGLTRDEKNVRAARTFLKQKNCYGRISVARLMGDRLPFVDNLVNLLVAEDPEGVSPDEMVRVLAPRGVLLLKKGATWGKTVKPWPESIDEWPQYLHGADNNAVAQDQEAGPPRHLQWTARPVWSRSHMAIPTVVSMVSARGRLFTIEDRAPVENPFLPGKWFLIARDAFNGTVLWKYKFRNWEPVTRYIKDIAVQLQRRLAAIDGKVYCTPGLDAPLTELDAATGAVLKVYKGTEKTQEFAVDGGVVYLVIGDRMNAARYNIEKPESWRGMSLGGVDPKAPFMGTGWRGSYAPETEDKTDPVCSIVALNAVSGKELWKKENIHHYTGCSLAVRGAYAVYQTALSLVCLDRRTGGNHWIVEKEMKSGDGTSPNTVVLSDATVYAQEGKKLFAYSLADGKELWSAPIAGNYEKSADLFLAAGCVWTGGVKQPTAYDPQTGRKLRTIRQRMTGPMGHDRCYRNFITERYYINSKTGGADFLPLDGTNEFPHHWTRGTCGMGVIPCNGLLYAGPYSCQCSIGVMFEGFNAYRAEAGLKSSGREISIPRTAQLIKGSAYGNNLKDSALSGDADGGSWPAYRFNATRDGVTPEALPPKLSRLWEHAFSAKISPPVVAAGKVFLSQVDRHTVCALSVADGSLLWEYTAGARVDSPPAYYNGMIFFGCRDGWVHCLAAGTGALRWSFKDLPDRLICARGQLESAWPVCGSVLVHKDLIYYSAGRVSFLDGGIVLSALEPATGKLVHRRRIYGPFNKKNGFPATRNSGFKNDILVTDGEQLYLRHKAFAADLSDAASPKPHVLPTAGFTGSEVQHRTYWTVATGYYNSSGIFMPQWRAPWGDILATDGGTFYEVRGFPVKRHSYFDPRLKGYLLFAGKVPLKLPNPKGKTVEREKTGIWQKRIPMTGEAIVCAGDTLCVAGRPAYFPPDHPVEKYRMSYEGKSGGMLRLHAASDGGLLTEYRLTAPPVWDGMAAAGGRLYLSTKDGRVICMGTSR